MKPKTYRNCAGLSNYSASLERSNYIGVREKMEGDCANLTSDEGLPFFNRVLRTLELSEFD